MNNQIAMPSRWATAFNFKACTFCIPAIVAVFGLAIQSANADMIDLNAANFNPGFSAPFGTVTILGDTTLGTVTITLDTARTEDLFQEFGFNSSLANPGQSVFSVMTTATGWTNPVAGPGSFTMDGFGKFNYNTSVSGDANRVNHLEITVQFLNMSDYGDATVANFNVANTKGRSFAAHLIPFDTDGVTGFIADGPEGIPGIPEPASILLFGFGAFGLAGLRFRRRQRAA